MNSPAEIAYSCADMRTSDDVIQRIEAAISQERAQADARVAEMREACSALARKRAEDHADKVRNLAPGFARNLYADRMDEAQDIANAICAIKIGGEE